jgi:hypothetical protein
MKHYYSDQMVLLSETVFVIIFMVIIVALLKLLAKLCYDSMEYYFCPYAAQLPSNRIFVIPILQSSNCYFILFQRIQCFQL